MKINGLQSSLANEVGYSDIKLLECVKYVYFSEYPQALQPQHHDRKRQLGNTYTVSRTKKR